MLKAAPITVVEDVTALAAVDVKARVPMGVQEVVLVAVIIHVDLHAVGHVLMHVVIHVPDAIHRVIMLVVGHVL